MRSPHSPAALGAPAVVGALALVVQAVSLPIEVAAMALSRVPYDPLRQTISDLGATTCTAIPYPAGPVSVCSPLHDAVGASGILAGILLLLAAVLLPLGVPGRSRVLAGCATVLLAITALSTLVTALIPLDADLALHTLVSMPVILVGPIAWASAVTAWGEPTGAVARVAMWGLALVATLCGAVVLFTLDSFGLMGLLERVAIWVPTIGFAALGIELLARARSRARGRRPARTSAS